jgi:hypothetical protein
MRERRAIRPSAINLYILYGKSESMSQKLYADNRYAFKKERGHDDPIEIEDDDDWVDPSRKFYWNPYSGELSLTFPTSNTKAKGGILADAMGQSCLSCLGGSLLTV